MIEMTKEKNLEQRLLKSCERADKTQNAILFSYSFRFEIRDLLPILAHPIDKNTIRLILCGHNMIIYRLWRIN